jgi:hypothetical protein
MSFEELNGKYDALKSELDAAYAAPQWDSQRINRITEQMVPIEVAIASCQQARHARSSDHE